LSSGAIVIVDRAIAFNDRAVVVVDRQISRSWSCIVDRDGTG